MVVKNRELIVVGNSLETFRSIMEVPRGFQNPEPNPNCSYQKPSSTGGKGSFFHKQSSIT
jgi:hypothetical protein